MSGSGARVRQAAKKLGKPTRKDVISGLVTGLFSIPEGMAYASIGGFLPVQGLYSGMAPTIVGSLFARTALMITTLTSAIALTAKSALNQAGLQPTGGNVAMLTLMAGVMMLICGVAKLGSLMAFVSNAVMTGFTTGISLQIIVGVLKDLTGFHSDHTNTLVKAGDTFAHISDWSGAAVAVSAATVVVWLLVFLVKPLRHFGTLIALFAVTIVVALAQVDVSTVGDIAAVPQAAPAPIWPDWSAAPSLITGAVAVALVALAQGAGIGIAVPNPDGSRPNVNTDFMAQGAANIAGSIFQALPTGGSLSRTGVAQDAGARTRWAGVFSGIWLLALVLVAGKYAEFIPMPVIGGLVLIIGVELIVGRVPDIVLILRTAPLSAVAMVATFLCTTQLPLQQAILIGALISLVLSCAGMVHGTQLRALTPTPDGSWKLTPIPARPKSGEVVTLSYGGAALFAQLARLDEQWPDFRGVTGTALVADLGQFADVPSTKLVTTLCRRAERLRAQGCRLLIAGVDKRGYQFLERTKAMDSLGRDNVFLEGKVLGESLHRAYAAARTWVDAQVKSAAAGVPPEANGATASDTEPGPPPEQQGDSSTPTIPDAGTEDR